MIITPPEHDALSERSNPAELLIKEARRKARRRRLAVGAVVLTAVTVAAGVSYGLVSNIGRRTVRSGATSQPEASLIPKCALSALRVSVRNGDGLHHGVEFISFSNSGRTSCSISGFPSVEAVLDSGEAPHNEVGIYSPSPLGARKRATDAESSWAGGVDVGDAAPKTFVAPVIVLKAHSGVASSTLNWIDGPNGNATCPAFSTISIGIGGKSVTRFVRAYEPLCYEFVVTPIVAGNTGSMFVAADYSKKANALSNAKASTANLNSDVEELHRDLESQTKYSFNQEMQVAWYVQESSQTLAQEDTPWARLNSLLSIVSQDGQAYGEDAVLRLMGTGRSDDVQNAYLRYVASMKSVKRMLDQLS